MDTDAIKTEVTFRLGNRSDISSRAINWINSAYLNIGTRFRFRELECTKTTTTVDGTREYAKSPDTFFVRSLYDETNIRFLKRVDWSDLERLTASAGKPTRWARYENDLIVDPTPDGAYVLRARGVLRPTVLTFPGDNTVNHVFGTEWDEAIIRKSVEIGHAALLEVDKAAEALQLYNMWVNEMRDVESLEDADIETTIGWRG